MRAQPTTKQLIEMLYERIPELFDRPQQEPLTNEEINLLINGRGEEGDDDYVEPTGDGFGITNEDIVRLIRRVESKHNIKE